MNAVMTWVITKRYRLDNPMTGIEITLPKSEKIVVGRKALPYEQIHDCIKTTYATSATMATKLCLHFIILTAVRSNEARLATWDETDLASRVWSIPKERMKTPRPHRIPLTSEMIKLLRKTQGVYGRNGYLFPGAKISKPLSDVTLSKLIKENGYAVDVHGFRTTFRTWTQEQTEVAREVAEMALAHGVGDKTEQAYARSDLFAKSRKLMKMWRNYTRGCPR